MIESFADKRLKRFFDDGDRSKLPPDMVRRIDQILTAIDLASTVDELALPSFRLHQLEGDLREFYSITVRANWRIIFRFQDGRAGAVELIDYH